MPAENPRPHDDVCFVPQELSAQQVESALRASELAKQHQGQLVTGADLLPPKQQHPQPPQPRKSPTGPLVMLPSAESTPTADASAEGTWAMFPWEQPTTPQAGVIRAPATNAALQADALADPASRGAALHSMLQVWPVLYVLHVLPGMAAGFRLWGFWLKNLHDLSQARSDAGLLNILIVCSPSPSPALRRFVTPPTRMRSTGCPTCPGLRTTQRWVVGGGQP
jgi:hypothetical protein